MGYDLKAFFSFTNFNFILFKLAFKLLKSIFIFGFLE